MRAILSCATALLFAITAASASSVPIAGPGINHAAAVSLHCVNAVGFAQPCGGPSLPIVVAPAAGPLTSRTASVPAQTSTLLFPANPARRYLAIQVPSTGAVWINLMGGGAAPNAPDCINLQPGTLYESGSFVNTGALTIYVPSAVTVSAWEG